MKDPAPVEVEISKLLSDRRSPYAFDPERDVSETDMRALMEAARWAASASNIQPWRYIVGVRGRSDEVRERVHSVLLGGNQPWTANAPVLILTVVNTENDGKPNVSAEHDMGLASAQLTVEATARGLVVHQMAGVDLAAANAEFGIAKPERVLTALAVGYQASAEVIPENYARRDEAPRTRKSIDDMIVVGSL